MMRNGKRLAATALHLLTASSVLVVLAIIAGGTFKNPDTMNAQSTHFQADLEPPLVSPSVNDPDSLSPIGSVPLPGETPVRLHEIEKPEPEVTVSRGPGSTIETSANLQVLLAKDESPAARIQALDTLTLSFMGRASYDEVLLATFLNASSQDEHPSGRRASLRTLALLDDDRAWAAVRNALAHDPSLRVRAWLRDYVLGLAEGGEYANSLSAFGRTASGLNYELLANTRADEVRSISSASMRIALTSSGETAP